MKVRQVLGLVTFVIILFLVAGSGLAREIQPTESAETASASANAAANARWFTSEIDTPGDTGQHTSMVIDHSTGTTYISYYDATNKTLRLAMNKGFGSGGNCGPDNSWLCQTVDSTYGVGQYSSIDVHSLTGEIGISYYDATNSRLMYAHGKICATCSWSIGIIDQPLSMSSVMIGKYSSLEFNPSGTAYVAYYFENPSNVDALMVAYYRSSGGNCGYGTALDKWQCDTIQTGEGVGQYASLALDGVGNRHIAYYDGGNGDLWYTTSRADGFCNGNTWLCYPVDSANVVGQYASLFMDRDNHFHIAYYDATAEKLKYAVDVGSLGNCGVLGSSARCETIDSMPSGFHPMGVSMTKDAAGYPIIAYQSENGSLNLAQPVAALGLSGGSGNCGPETPFSTWYCKTIDRSGKYIAYRHGDFVSIALNRSGLATIAYNEYITASDGNLAVAYQRFQIFEPLVLKNH